MKEALLLTGGIAGVVAALLGTTGLPSQGSAEVLIALGAIIALTLSRAPRSRGGR